MAHIPDHRSHDLPPSPAAPPYDLWQLRCCVTLAETLHFGRAADLLHMTQPPLSRQIAQLESRLGVRLFDRDRRSVALTAAGRYFVNEARAILERVEHVAIDTRLVADGQRGAVTVGYTVAGSFEILPGLVRRHRERFPGVAFVLRDLLIDEQLRLLASGDLDVAIVRPPIDRRRFDCCTVMRDHWVVAMPGGHRFTALRSVALTELDGEAMIAWSPVSRHLHRQLERLYAQAGVIPRDVLSVSMPGAMLSMVGHGVGVAVVPGVMASQAPAGVRFRPLEVPSRPASVGVLESIVAWRRDESDVAVCALIETVRGMALPAAKP